MEVVEDDDSLQAIVDRNPAVASAALVSSFHLIRKNPEVVRRWANEVQEAVSSERFVYLRVRFSLIWVM